MSQDRRGSDASQSSLISYRSVENQAPETETQEKEKPSEAAESSEQPVHHVHFGSDLRFVYGDIETEDDADPPPRPGQRSLDITEAPERPATLRTATKSHRRKSSAGPPPDKGSLFHKLNGVRHTVADRTRHLATRLGRSPDDPRPDGYPDWTEMQPQPQLSTPESTHTHTDHDTSSSEAHRLVRDMTHDQPKRPHHRGHRPNTSDPTDYFSLPTATSTPGQHSSGVLSHLLRLNASLDPRRTNNPPSPTSPSSPQTPGTTTPRHKPKWYKKPPNTSSSTLIPNTTNPSGASTPVSSEVLTAASKRRGKQTPNTTLRLEDEIQATLQIAQIIARQRYIMQLCKALMLFGAPTHRLEEYMRMTARTLNVDSQYLYLPGCMIMSFDDASTRTAEVKLVRVVQGVDLGRLADTHNVYKNVMHDVVGIEEAIHELDEIISKPPRFNKFTIVLVSGLATAAVGPFAFSARPIDLPPIFFNGCLLATMQHVLAPLSPLYSNVFEVSATVLTSFIARALGSITIHNNTTHLFCFSAIAQSSIALILPGYTVLCSSLELQSHQIVAGSIRMVYAIIYSLFLGFGITVGTTIYGLLDGAATSETSCPTTWAIRDPYAQRFPFVVVFALCLVVVNQGKWKQAPAMIPIALAGYVTNFFVTRRLGTASQVANTVGACTIGILGNLYSRLWHGHAATAILPGIFVLVPSGLAATGSLVNGVKTADAARRNDSSIAGGNEAGVQVLGYGMVQVAIGITVGLFVAALVVYPYGKRRSGLFSF